MIEENKANYYAIIPAMVRYDNNLRPAEKIMYGELTALSSKNGYCHAKNRYFAELYNVSIETVSKWISNLQRLGYINIKIKRDENQKVIARYIYLVDLDSIERGQVPIDKKDDTSIWIKNFIALRKKIHTLLKK